MRQGGDWQRFGPVLDASVISDEGGRGEHASFTGAFVGMVAMDITGQGREALFEHFDYLPGGAG
jgi:xylan 1,4-beta-xylosidase